MKSPSLTDIPCRPHHWPCPFTVDGPGEGHQREGDEVVPGAPGFPLRCATPGGDGQRQRRWTLPDLGSFRRSVRIHSPPSPSFPILPRTQDDAWGGWGGGGGDRCPERSLPSPWKPTRIICTSSSRAGQAHPRLVTAGLDKPPQHTHWWDMSPEDSMLTLNLHCIPESSVWPASPPHTSTARRTATGKHDHGTEDSHWRARAQVFRGAPITNPRQREVYIPETLNKLTLWGIYWLPLSCDSSPRYNIYIYIYTHIYITSRKFLFLHLT